MRLCIRMFVSIPLIVPNSREILDSLFLSKDNNPSNFILSGAVLQILFIKHVRKCTPIPVILICASRCWSVICSIMSWRSFKTPNLSLKIWHVYYAVIKKLNHSAIPLSAPGRPWSSKISRISQWEVIIILKTFSRTFIVALLSRLFRRESTSRWMNINANNCIGSHQQLTIKQSLISH